MKPPILAGTVVPPVFTTKFIQALAAFSALGLSCADASVGGQSISVNFGADQALSFMVPTDVAGVVPSANWNNAGPNVGSLTDLVLDNLGVASPILGSTVSWSANNNWTTDQENNTSQFTGGDEIMMNGYLDNNVGQVGSILFAGLPNGIYDIYVYSLTAVVGRDSGNIVVNGVQEKSISATSSTFFEGGGPGGPDNVGGFPGNFNLYPGVSVTDGQVNIVMPGDTFRTAVNGVELVVVPEPSSLILAALSGAGVLGLRRRRS